MCGVFLFAFVVFLELLLESSEVFDGIVEKLSELGVWRLGASLLLVEKKNVDLVSNFRSECAIKSAGKDGLFEARREIVGVGGFFVGDGF